MGFREVWLQQGVGNVEVFLHHFSTRLLDIDRQGWLGHLTRYGILRILLRLFHVEVNQGRWADPPVQYALRLCRLCKSRQVDDEAPVFVPIVSPGPHCGWVSQVPDTAHSIRHVMHRNASRTRYVRPHQWSTKEQWGLSVLLKDTPQKIRVKPVSNRRPIDRDSRSLSTRPLGPPSGEELN